MPSLGGQARIILLGSLSVAALACCGVFAGEQQASAQTDSDPPLINGTAVNSPSANSSASIGDDQAQFKLHVESNLVVVRAVVRDSQGQAVKNLRAVLMFVEGAFHRFQLANHLFRAVDQVQLFS